MTKSPQFRQAILRNLEKIDSIKIDIERGATIYGVYPKDYSKHKYLRQQKHPNIFSSFFLQKVF